METTASSRRGVSGKALKYFAAVFMVIDSLYLRMNLPSVMHLVTRFVAPLFAYLMVDGFFYTHNRRKYAGRLWLAAALMQAGNQLSYLLFGERGGISDNIFLTLALGFSMIWLMDTAKKRTGGKKFMLHAAAVGILIAGLALSFVPVPLAANCYILIEGGLTVLPLILIAYLFHGRRGMVALLYTAYCLLIGVVLYGFPASLASGGFDMFCVNSDWLGCLAVPFFFLYNGEGGRRRRFDKKFFYVFYPAHLWIITLALYSLR